MRSRLTRRRARRWLTAAVVTALLASTACSSPAPGADAPGAAATGIRGPLCPELPQGSEPGGPIVLATQPADEALKWMPVLTVFEAASRATAMTKELGDAESITILAPTDGAFEGAMSASTLDELLLKRQDELRAVLENHIVDEELSLAEMIEAGEVTTRSGATIKVGAAEDGMAALDGRAETVCADYKVANARIHLIGGVLGELPEPAATEEPHVG